METSLLEKLTLCTKSLVAMVRNFTSRFYAGWTENVHGGSRLKIRNPRPIADDYDS